MIRTARFTLTIGAALLLVALGAPLAADSSRSDLPAGPPKVTGNHPSGGGEAAPPNDNFANATVISPIPFTDVVDTTDATDEAGEPASSCTLAGNGVWYVHANTSGGLESFDANTFASDYDTVLDVYTGTWGSLTEIACNDDAGGTTGLQSSVSLLIPAGETIYVRAGGFDGDTGSLQFDVPTLTAFACAPVEITGQLGSGSAGWPSVSGVQNARLNRNGIASTCAAPKACDIFAAGSFDYDAYTIPNLSGASQCVTINLEVLDQETCNLQSNAYLGSFDPNNICTNYLADPGLSSGIPPTPTVFSGEVPAGESLVVEVHSLGSGMIGCNYTVTVIGDICQQTVTQEVPTLSRYGLAALALLMLGGAVFFLRRRRPA